MIYWWRFEYYETNIESRIYYKIFKYFKETKSTKRNGPSDYKVNQIERNAKQNSIRNRHQNVMKPPPPPQNGLKIAFTSIFSSPQSNLIIMDPPSPYRNNLVTFAIPDAPYRHQRHHRLVASWFCCKRKSFYLFLCSLLLLFIRIENVDRIKIGFGV